MTVERAEAGYQIATSTGLKARSFTPCRFPGSRAPQSDCRCLAVRDGYLSSAMQRSCSVDQLASRRPWSISKYERKPTVYGPGTRLPQTEVASEEIDCASQSGAIR